MRRQCLRYVHSCLIALVAALWSVSSHAIVVSIDQFSVTRNGVAIFTDGFTDGVPPPSGVGTLSYFVRGTFPAGSESGGKLLLDTANGVPVANAGGAPRVEVNATLLTDTSDDLTLGLKIDDTLRVTGIFDLLAPTGPLFSAYGVRFHDAGPGESIDQAVQLFIRYNDITGQAEIAYILQDFVASSITVFGAVPLSSFVPAGADQIVLYIDRPDATSNDFYGHFYFLQAGTQVGGSSVFITPGQMFDGENYVRAQFFAAQALPVPEPGSGWLAIAGLLLVATAVRMRGRSRRTAGRGFTANS